MALIHETAGSCEMEVGYFLMTYSHVWTCRHTASITRDCSLNAVVELWAAFLPASLINMFCKILIAFICILDGILDPVGDADGRPCPLR